MEKVENSLVFYMDVIIIFNGLGNQMSQYAFYLQKKQISKSTRYIFSKKSKKIHNGFELNTVFGIPYYDNLFNKILYLIFIALEYKKYPWVTKPFIKLLHFLGISIIRENDDYDFKPDYLKTTFGIRFYVGGWHSEKYFMNVKDLVKETFQFKILQIDSENLNVLQKIKSTNSVSVHIRRGDFLDVNNYNKFGSVCTLNYFLIAIQKMRTLVKEPHFYFFTNDTEWVAKNFIGADFSIISINKSKNSWKDMFLISNCLNQINSNGSFSWWSSWLNANKDKFVIVPKKFIANVESKDIYPEEWIKLDDY